MSANVSVDLTPQQLFEQCPWQAEGKQILVVRDSETKRTKAGLYLVDNSNKKPSTGRVINFGPDYGGSAYEGSRVLWDQFAGMTIAFSCRNDQGNTERVELVVLDQDDILAIHKDS